MDDDGSYAEMQQYILNSKLEASTKELKVSTFHNVFFKTGTVLLNTL